MRSGILVACCAAVAMLAACQKKPVKVSDSPQAGAAPGAADAPQAGDGPVADTTAAEPFTLTLASGGGFTGIYTGCTLKSDGSASFWERRGAGTETVKSRAQGDAGKVREFLRLLRPDGALPAPQRESGNMTTSVKLQSADTLHAWSWAGPGVDDKTPQPFRTWYAKAEAYCRELEGKATPQQEK